jgi:hypothetical protein
LRAGCGVESFMEEPQRIKVRSAQDPALPEHASVAPSGDDAEQESLQRFVLPSSEELGRRQAAQFVDAIAGPPLRQAFRIVLESSGHFSDVEIGERLLSCRCRDSMALNASIGDVLAKGRPY